MISRAILNVHCCAGALLLAAGCAAGPDFRRPEAPAVERYTSAPLPETTSSADIAGGGAQRFVSGRDVPARWWKLFESPALDALVDQALKANPDVQAAQAALRAARESALAQRGAFYPGVQANFSPSRQKVAEPVSSPLNSGDSVFNLHTAQVSVSYVPDVFGLNRRQVEASDAQSELQRFQLEATYLTLTANLVAAAVQEAALREQIAQTEEIIRVETEQLALVTRQFELGAVAEAAVVTQDAVLAQSLAAIPQLHKQLSQQRNVIAALAGRFPGEEPAERFILGQLRLPAELPVSLPSRLVEQRPDIRAAEAQLHAASAQVGIATANMLPQITLTANGGNTATQMARLFSPQSVFWNVAGNLVQPVFQGGALLHRKRSAEAAYDQAAAQYRAVVLTAFRNVSDTLQALSFDADALLAAVAAEQATALSMQIARLQMELGDISYLALLGSEQTYRQAVINRVQAQANRFADTAALFQGLGGGWWNRASDSQASR